MKIFVNIHTAHGISATTMMTVTIRWNEKLLFGESVVSAATQDSQRKPKNQTFPLPPPKRKTQPNAEH